MFTVEIANQRWMFRYIGQINGPLSPKQPRDADALLGLAEAPKRSGRSISCRGKVITRKSGRASKAACLVAVLTGMRGGREGLEG